MIGSPLGLLILAAVLMLLSVVLAFLMVMRLIEPTLLLCFLSFALSIAGTIIGFIGTAQYLGPRRRGGDPGSP